MSEVKPMACPICGDGAARTIYSDIIPIFVSMLFKNGDKRLEKNAAIDILACDSCLHGFHAQVWEELAEEYYLGGEYQYHYFGLANASRFGWVANIVSDVCTSSGFSTVTEIACGMGEVLDILAQRGLSCQGIDINPAVRKLEKRENPRIHCIGLDEFSPESKCDVVLARLFLEHVDAPRRTIERFRQLLKPEGVMVLEVPNCTEALLNGRFWEFHHEHRQYYSLYSIKRLLYSCGYNIAQVHMNPDATIMIVVAKQMATNDLETPGKPSGVAKAVIKKDLLEDLTTYISQAKKVLWWGAGLTGVRLLGSIHSELWPIITVVDGDPGKIGLCLPGSKMEVHPSSVAKTLEHDFVFIASISSAKEIIRLIRRNGYLNPVMYLAGQGHRLFLVDNCG